MSQHCAHEIDGAGGEPARFDAIVVGAGFAGLYMLYRLRELGYRVRVYEAGDGVGGTWYWNRYPGARCDAESLAYSYSFAPELDQEWEWSERYATQPEILRYAEHVADRFDLRRDIRFERRVSSARYQEADGLWQVTTESGDRACAPICIMATGCLSVPHVPDLPGLERFAGELYQASLWPHHEVDFAGKRVGIIGTGSSAIQAIPVVAEQAVHLTVFQRTPNFSVPARNYRLDPEFVVEFKRNYRQHREMARLGRISGFGGLRPVPVEQVPAVASSAELSDAQLEAILEEYWDEGGARFMGAVGDALLSEETNQRVAEFVRAKIRGIVRDPETAEILCPTSHPIGTKRICVDSRYYETFNRDNVTLIDAKRLPITEITAAGVVTGSGEHPLDVLILATGFDAMTGALLRMDIRGADGLRLEDAWQAGPRTYLGLAITGFPNLFTITGPGSPSVLSNMMISIEQHVDWIIGCLRHMGEQGYRRIEATLEAQEAWVSHVDEVANATLFPKGGSWYLGANVPGKPRQFMPYAAGVGVYREICDRVAAEDYRGFAFA
jgi:cyclohexanone monooxygenase